MRLIDADAIKQKHRDRLVKSLVDKDRGIDLSEHAEKLSKSFNRFIDEIPTVDVLDQITAEIERIEGNQFEVSDNQGNRYTYETIEKGEVLQIIDKYKGDKE